MNRQFFAQLNNDNVVIDVHCVTAEFMAENPQRYLGVWVETFYNTEGKKYAGIGFIYNEATKDFVEPVSEVESEI
jgi:hypothetical protein